MSNSKYRDPKTYHQHLVNRGLTAQAARELRVIASECVRLAKLTGYANLIEEAERAAALLPL